MIADAMEKVGKEGVISLVEVHDHRTGNYRRDALDKGYISPYFATDPERDGGGS